MDSVNSNSKEMGDVPVELLVSNILTYFDETQLQKLRSVSREWKETIDTFFGQTVRISSSNWGDLKQSTNVKSAVVEHWNEGLYPEAEELARGLRELEIRNPEGTMTISNLFPLIAACDNLTTLVVHKIYDGDATKNEPQSDLLKNQIGGSLLPNLKTLKFIDVQNLEQMRYPVYLELPAERKKMEILRALMKTLAATKTLKNVDVTMINSHWALPLITLFLVDSTKERNFPDASFCEIPILGLGVEKLSQLESFILRTHTEGVAISMYFHPKEMQRKLTCDLEKDQRRRQLRKFAKCGYIKETKSPKFNFINNLNMSHLWLDILETQFNLEEIEYEFIFGEPDQNWERFEGILQRNRGTLRSLKLFNTSRRASQTNLWSGSDFSGLERLESLSLVNLCSRSLCGPSASPTKQQQPVEVIKDLGNLPTTLKTLELHCPFDARDQEDISSLFKSLSNLESLKLISNENDKPWWFFKEESKWLLGGKELEVFITSLPRLKLFDIYWRPVTENGATASRISHCLLRDLRSSVVAEKTVNIQYFPQYKLKYLQTEREFRRCKITIV